MPVTPHSSRRAVGRDRSRGVSIAGGAAIAGGLCAAVLLALPSGAGAAGSDVPLGTAASYSVLGGQSVSNTGPTTLDGDLGVSPGTAISGFPPGVVGGAQHNADANALQAQSDVTIAYNNLAGRAETASAGTDLVGRTFTAGVYTASSSLLLTGTVTLDAQGDPNAQFIFQVGSTLTTGSASHVALINGAQACNVWWQIGSSATLGTASTFIGNILALTSIIVTTGVTVEGRALARNGSVTLDTNVFTKPGCDTSPGGSGTGTGGSGTGTGGSGTGTGGSGTGTGGSGTGTGGSGTGTGGSGTGTGGSGTGTGQGGAGSSRATESSRAADSSQATGSTTGETGSTTGGTGSTTGQQDTTTLASTGTPSASPLLILSPILLLSGGLLIMFGQRRRGYVARHH